MKKLCMCVQIRSFQTSATQRDIDQAAKYIGAGAATVGVAGSGKASCSQEMLLFLDRKSQITIANVNGGFSV